MNAKKINYWGLKEVLSEKEMKLVLGAGCGDGAGSGSGVYRCCCGMGSDISCYNVSAISLDAAMKWIETYCPTLWGTDYGGCFM